MKIIDQLRGSGLFSPATWEGAVVYGVIFIVLAWLLGRGLRVTVERLLARDTHDHFDRMAIKFLAKLFRYGVYVFAFVAYAHFIPSLASLGTASLTSISVITVIVGLAAQNTLGNLVAGISLLLYRPFKLGDRLSVLAPTGVETGWVESLTLGYTLLRTDDNRHVVIPNSLMASQTNINLTGNDPRVICAVQIGIRDAVDLDRAREILFALAAAHPQARERVGCLLTQLGSAGAVLTLEVWCADAYTAILLRCDLLEQAAKRFAAAGIALPFQESIVVLKDTRGTPAGGRVIPHT